MSHKGDINRRCREKSPARYIFTAHKSNEKRKGREFLIPLEWIEKKIAAGICEQSGLPFVLKMGSHDPLIGINPFYPSIDRINSSLGYTESNCQMVCTIYNLAKSTFSHADVMILARALVAKACKEPI